jgi:adenylyltransferase/sulfurtransferase
MSIAFYVAGHLTAFTEGENNLRLAATPGTVREALEDLWKAYPGLRDRVVTEQGRVRPHVIVFIGTDDIRNLDGLETPVSELNEISILPAVSGG